MTSEIYNGSPERDSRFLLQQTIKIIAKFVKKPLTKGHVSANICKLSMNGPPGDSEREKRFEKDEKTS